MSCAPPASPPRTSRRKRKLVLPLHLARFQRLLHLFNGSQIPLVDVQLDHAGGSVGGGQGLLFACRWARWELHRRLNSETRRPILCNLQPSRSAPRTARDCSFSCSISCRDPGSGFCSRRYNSGGGIITADTQHARALLTHTWRSPSASSTVSLYRPSPAATSCLARPFRGVRPKCRSPTTHGDSTHRTSLHGRSVGTKS